MAGGAKTADKMIKWNGSIFWISGDVEIFASIGLIFTHWYQVIRKMRFDESGTGSRVKGNLRFIPRPLKELTFFQLRVSTLHPLLAYFTIMVHLPNNFLKPGCSCGNNAITCDTVIAIYFLAHSLQSCDIPIHVRPPFVSSRKHPSLRVAWQHTKKISM